MLKFLKTKSMIYATLATVFSLLVILFTYLSTQAKEKEAKDAEKKLRDSVEQVSDTLSESLKKTSEVVKNINSLGDSLNDVKIDLKNQVDLLENSVDEAKRFQKLVDEQNKRDVKRFELESANIVCYSQNVEFVPSKGDTNEYVFQNRFVNEGKRNGTLLSMQSMLLLTDENLNLVKEIFIYENSPEVLVTGKDGSKQGRYEYWSNEKFEKQYLESSNNNMVYIIRYKYEDEALADVKEEFQTFRWWGFSEGGLKFSNLSSVSKPKFIEYFKNEFD